MALDGVVAGQTSGQTVEDIVLLRRSLRAESGRDVSLGPRRPPGEGLRSPPAGFGGTVLAFEDAVRPRATHLRPRQLRPLKTLDQVAA